MVASSLLRWAMQPPAEAKPFDFVVTGASVRANTVTPERAALDNPWEAGTPVILSRSSG